VSCPTKEEKMQEEVLKRSAIFAEKISLLKEKLKGLETTLRHTRKEINLENALKMYDAFLIKAEEETHLYIERLKDMRNIHPEWWGDFENFIDQGPHSVSEKFLDFLRENTICQSALEKAFHRQTEMYRRIVDSFYRPPQSIVSDEFKETVDLMASLREMLFDLKKTAQSVGVCTAYQNFSEHLLKVRGSLIKLRESLGQ